MSPAKGHFKPGGYETACLHCAARFRVLPSDVRKAQRNGHRVKPFCSRRCQWSSYAGDGNPKWRGGTYRATNGYIYEYAPDHPHAKQDGYVMQHRLVVERAIGRHLDPTEEVHHRNHARDDNRPENLELMPSKSAHRTHHGEWRLSPCRGCGTPVRSSAGQRRRGLRRYCSRRCSALAGSRAAAAKLLDRKAAS